MYEKVRIEINQSKYIDPCAKRLSYFQCSLVVFENKQVLFKQDSCVCSSCTFAER